jgi:hypothetical protein
VKNLLKLSGECLLAFYKLVEREREREREIEILMVVLDSSCFQVVMMGLFECGIW